MVWLAYSIGHDKENIAAWYQTWQVKNNTNFLHQIFKNSTKETIENGKEECVT